MSKRSADFKKDIVFKAISKGFLMSEFTVEDFCKSLGISSPWETDERERSTKQNFLYKNFTQAHSIGNTGSSDVTPEETIFFCLKRLGTFDVKKSIYCLTTEAKFKYIDFLELELARKNSEQAQKNALSAQRHALKSINIAWAALVVSILGTVTAFISLFIEKTT